MSAKRKPNESDKIDVSNEAPLTEKQFQMLQLATTLASSVLSTKEKSEHLETKGFDRLFLSALKRAESLMDRVSGKSDETVHAYQLFEPELMLTVDEIAAVFDDYGWSGMTTKNTIDKILKKILTKLDEHLEEAAQAGYSLSERSEPFQLALETIATFLNAAAEEENMLPFRQAMQILTKHAVFKFEKIVGEASHLSEQGFSHELWSAFTQLRLFKDACSLNEPKYEARTTTTVTKYCPHLLFRYAAEHGLEQKNTLIQSSELRSKTYFAPVLPFLSVVNQVSAEECEDFGPVPNYRFLAMQLQNENNALAIKVKELEESLAQRANE